MELHKIWRGNYIYENNILKQISHPEGYIEPNGSSWQYVYRYADIWGNTRITYADDNNDGNIDASTEIRREQNYYPFGLEHKGYNNMLSGVKNNLKTYQGQEFTEDLGLNTHEWRYRISDPAIGRFWQVDPLAEDYMYNSTYAFQENKMGMGVELEGLEFVGWDILQAASMDAVENPNGVGAHSLGIGQGLANTVTDVVDAVTHPVETAEGMGQLLDLGFTMQFGGALDQDNINTMVGIGTAVEGAVDDLANGNGIERGTVIGEIAGAAIGTKGATAATKTLSTAIKANKTTKVFRAFGGDSGPGGKSFTPVNPNSVGNFRDAAGLPSGGAFGTNTARFMIEGTVKQKNILLRRRALPMDGNRGGLPEIVVKDATKVKIKRVSGVNPQF